MSDFGLTTVGNYNWDSTTNRWYKDTGIVTISGVTVTGGKLDVNTELEVSGIVIENVKVFADENYNLQYGRVNSSTRRVQVDVPSGVGITSQPPVIVSGIIASLPTGTNNIGRVTADIDNLDPILVSGITITDGKFPCATTIANPVIVSGVLTTISVSGIGTSDYTRLLNSDDLVVTIQYNEANTRTTVSGITYSSTTLGFTAYETFASGTNTLLITRSR